MPVQKVSVSKITLTGIIPQSLLLEFNSDKLTAKAFWANGFVDLPFVDLERDACKTTSCPIVENKSSTYTYSLTMKKSYPYGTYDVKWKLIGEQDDELCCMLTKIKIVK